MNQECTVSLSIVSHGQGHLIRFLLMDLRTALFACDEIILTLNIPEDEAFVVEFNDLPIRVLRNDAPKGFGANHNAAFKACSTNYFVVVNPDIRIGGAGLELLLEQLKWPDVGLAAPVVYSSKGELQDSARCFPSFGRLISRRLRGQTEPDYQFNNGVINVDWVAGMFMVFRSETFLKIGGFDERYFMYMEDVDLCKRLHVCGYRVVLVPGARVIHDAQRASRRKLKYFIWHVTSALRFLLCSKSLKAPTN